jgi:hypothetical protein
VSVGAKTREVIGGLLVRNKSQKPHPKNIIVAIAMQMRKAGHEGEKNERYN